MYILPNTCVNFEREHTISSTNLQRNHEELYEEYIAL